MCPAPAPLHLERYIGSCLISAGYHHHHHHHHHHHNNNFQKKESQQTRYRRYPPQTHCHQNSEYCGPGNGNISSNSGPPGTPYPRSWTTAGVPLISMTPASPRRGIIKDKQQDERSPLSRLAIHTQGAPLIQAGRQQPRIAKQNSKQSKKEKDQKDFSSVVSDESSGNSENSLPRIIKPRKRRKKDRKPQQTTGTTQPTQTSTEALQETAIVTLKPYTPLCQDFTPQNKTNSTVTNKNDEQLEGGNNKILKELPVDESISARCQCRYCDPINLTWDVDQRCYSPYLTAPTSYSSSQDWGFDSRESSLEVSSEIITSPNGHRDIEIKFFSASPPTAKSVPPARPISVTPPWHN